MYETLYETVEYVTEQLQVALGSRQGQSLTAGVAGYCCPFDPLTEFTDGPAGLV